MRQCPGLLVSVRSVAEAAAALEGGAQLIDVKEPSRGPLGRADDDTIAAVVRLVGGRRPVSAALGELGEVTSLPRCAGLDFVKWGLAGCRRRFAWRDKLAGRLIGKPVPRTVMVAYADWQHAEAPPVDEVVEFACQWPGATFLLDTFSKVSDNADGTKPSLVSWLSVDEVTQLCRSLREAQVRVTLAGSLDRQSISLLRCAEPDWFGVRGAVCTDGNRDGPILASRVRELVALLHKPAPVMVTAEKGGSP